MAQTIDLAHEKENAKRHNQEVEHAGEKHSVIDCCRTGNFRRRERRIVLSGQVDEQAGPVGVAENQTDGWHYYVFHKGSDDLSESHTEDYPDSHVKHAASQCKFTKILKPSPSTTPKQR
jgi:hypothetical protein